MSMLNINALYREMDKKEKRKLRVFNEVLQKCHQRIVTIVKKTGDSFCFFIVPTCIFGVPLYNTTSCVLYLVEQLIKNGFDVKYTHPNLLYISWFHRQNRQTNNNLMNPINKPNLLTYDKQQVKNNIKVSQGYKLVDNYNPLTKLINTNTGYNRGLSDFENKSDNLFSL